MTLEGRVALVTGGNRGIGRAISLALAADGCDVAVNYRRAAEEAEQTVAEIEGLGRRAIAVAAPVDDRDAVLAMVERATDELGPVGILVNNAGIASRGKSVADTEPDELRQVLAVHALGSYWCCQAVLPGMRDLDRGDIVFISSAAVRGMAGRGSPYNMAKAAEEALAYTLAKEEVRNGIRVNVVAPGLVETEMGARLVKATAGVDDMRQLDAVSPYGRVCQPDDVANVVRFLVSEGGSYVNGQKIHVDASGSP